MSDTNLATAISEYSLAIAENFFAKKFATGEVVLRSTFLTAKLTALLIVKSVQR